MFTLDEQCMPLPIFLIILTYSHSILLMLAQSGVANNALMLTCAGTVHVYGVSTESVGQMLTVLKDHVMTL